jgi:hypothetical protein
MLADDLSRVLERLVGFGSRAVDDAQPIAGVLSGASDAILHRIAPELRDFVSEVLARFKC